MLPKNVMQLVTIENHSIKTILHWKRVNFRAVIYENGTLPVKMIFELVIYLISVTSGRFTSTYSNKVNITKYLRSMYDVSKNKYCQFKISKTQVTLLPILTFRNSKERNIFWIRSNHKWNA